MSSPMTADIPNEKIPFRIHLLRAANPLITWLLTPRLHALLSRDLLVLHFRGRRSGRSLATPLSYVEQDGRLYLCTRPEVASWWRNLRGGASAEISWRGARVPARAWVLDAASEEAAMGFRAFLSRNPGTASLLYHVEVASDGAIDEVLLRHALGEAVVVRIESQSIGASQAG
jgi:hypothetical protein